MGCQQKQIEGMTEAVQLHIEAWWGLFVGMSTTVEPEVRGSRRALEPTVMLATGSNRPLEDCMKYEAHIPVASTAVASLRPQTQQNNGPASVSANAAIRTNQPAPDSKQQSLRRMTPVKKGSHTKGGQQDVDTGML
ncbi:unnamed protein product [Phytophthora fragariaefolia]|uniref:Unnamed protein product n=1 Tax=Phytophthora fragariaefolia TaxID=1490495 RepID=A0A9W6XVU7_9STRA|nr:unnamed protein product [Phytophthora fragariaefolia]